MKKTIKTQLLVLAFVGICIFSFIPAVYGRKRGATVNIRPIDDWVANNPFGIGVPWETAYVGGDGKGNHYWMWIDSLFGAFTGNLYEYSGYVKEKVLGDGSIEITVNLFVKDIYIEMYDALYDVNGDPIWDMQYFGDTGDLLSFGYANYYFRLKFTLDAEYDGYAPWGIPAGTREAGCMLPFFDAISYIPEQIGVHLQSLMLLGVGELYTYEPGFRWPAPGEEFPPWPDLDGGTAKIFFLHCAEFDGQPSGGFPGWGDWPFGSSSDFVTNTIRIFNIKN
ncbi:MAG: hypothetical protein ACW98X_18995 [Promethearchaeota archaeon]|jgi:hypothetical protein